MSYLASFLGSGRNCQLWSPCLWDSLVALFFLRFFDVVLLTVIIIRSLEVFHALASFLWMVGFLSGCHLDGIQNGSGLVSAFKYSGCFGRPALVFPRQWIGRAIVSHTWCSRSAEQLAPQAATTNPTCVRRYPKASSFPGPTGSSAAFITLGSVARKANAFIINRPP